MKPVRRWAVYDLQTSQYLHSGRNAKSLKQAVDEVWSLYIGTADFEKADLKKIGKWTLQEKKEWLENTQGFRFDQLDEPEPDIGGRR